MSEELPTTDIPGIHALRAETDSIAPGARFGAYTVIEVIASGGFGRVLRGHRIDPVAIDVAIKVLRSDRQSRRALSAFEAERLILASIDHPNVARFLDAGETEDGRLYMVMEFVRGDPVTKFARAHRLTLGARAALMTQACKGIHHAHELGLVHRDVKPDNMLVTYIGDDPVLKIVDFGIARLRGPASVLEHDSGDSSLAGTPGYLSPEQRGGTRLDVDRRSDVWALGVSMHVLATGVEPEWESAPGGPGQGDLLPPSAVLRRHKRLGELAGERRLRPAELVDQIAGGLDAILIAALDYDRSRRPATAMELGRQLAAWGESIERGSAVGTPGPRRPERAVEARVAPGRSSIRRVRAKAGLAVGVACVLSAVLLTALVVERRDRARGPASSAGPLPSGSLLGHDRGSSEGTSEIDPAVMVGNDPAPAARTERAPGAPGGVVDPASLGAAIRDAAGLDLIEVTPAGAGDELRFLVRGPLINDDEVGALGERLAAFRGHTVIEATADAAAVRRELERRIESAGLRGLDVAVRNQGQRFGATYLFVRLGMDAPEEAAQKIAALARGLAIDASLIRTTN